MHRHATQHSFCWQFEVVRPRGRSLALTGIKYEGVFLPSPLIAL